MCDPGGQQTHRVVIFAASALSIVVSSPARIWRWPWAKPAASARRCDPSSGLSLTDRSSPTQGARDQTKRPPVSAGGRFVIRYLDALEVPRVVSRVLGQLIGLVGQLERPGGLILGLLRLLVCLLRVFLSLLFWVVRAQVRRKSVVADRSCVQAWGRLMQRAHAYGESSCHGPHRRNLCDHADSPRQSVGRLITITTLTSTRLRRRSRTSL